MVIEKSSFEPKDGYWDKGLLGHKTVTGTNAFGPQDGYWDEGLSGQKTKLKAVTREGVVSTM